MDASGVAIITHLYSSREEALEKGIEMVVEALEAEPNIMQTWYTRGSKAGDQIVKRTFIIHGDGRVLVEGRGWAKL